MIDEADGGSEQEKEREDVGGEARHVSQLQLGLIGKLLIIAQNR